MYLLEIKLPRGIKALHAENQSIFGPLPLLPCFLKLAHETAPHAETEQKRSTGLPAALKNTTAVVQHGGFAV